MSVHRQTTVNDLMLWWKDHQVGKLNYTNAHRVLRNIKGDEGDGQAKQFALLPSYARHIQQTDLGSFVRLKVIGNRFSSIFIAPSSARAAFPHLRPVVCVNAAFTKTLHDYILLLACGIDANQQGINLAWAIAPKENEVHWRWFLSNLSDAFPSLNSPSSVLMSDRQKGLFNAVPIELSLVKHGFCCKHLERNLVTRYGQEVKSMFWRAVKARRKRDFDDAMGELMAMNER